MTSPGDASADEVRALLTTLTEWAQRAMPAPPSGHAGPECQWCPLCQLASVLRGEHPELTDRLADAGTAVSGAFRAVLEQAGRATPQADTGPRAEASPPTAPGPVRPRPAPRPRVERIQLDDTAGSG